MESPFVEIEEVEEESPAPEDIIDFDWDKMSTGKMSFTSYPNGGIKGIKS